MFQVGYTVYLHFKTLDTKLCKNMPYLGRLAFHPVYNNDSQPVGCRETLLKAINKMQLTV